MLLNGPFIKIKLSGFVLSQMILEKIEFSIEIDKGFSLKMLKIEKRLPKRVKFWKRLPEIFKFELSVIKIVEISMLFRQLFWKFTP